MFITINSMKPLSSILNRWIWVFHKWAVCVTLWVGAGVSGENNGIKKESLTKDATRLWINDGIKMQTFSHSLVNILLTQQ